MTGWEEAPELTQWQVDLRIVSRGAGGLFFRMAIPKPGAGWILGRCRLCAGDKAGRMAVSLSCSPTIAISAGFRIDLRVGSDQRIPGEGESQFVGAARVWSKSGR